MQSIFSLFKNPSLTVLALAVSLCSSTTFAALGDPAGSEFQVNTYTLADQQNSAVAINATGAFVVVWESSIQAPGDFSGIYAQRYDTSGAALGGEFQVNTLADLDDQTPRVAMNEAGAFVVVWEGTDQDGNLHVYSRRFAASGAAQGDDQEVTSTLISTSTLVTKPAVAMDSAGNYVVAWENFDESTGDEDIYARRFNAGGVAAGSDYRVNTTIANDQMSVALAMNSAGDYVISWQSAAQDGDGNGIYAQLYDMAGTLIKGEFQVNTTTTSEQSAPAVAMSDSGFVIAWQSLGQDGDGNGIYAQRYDAAGTPLGSEFQINVTTAGEQTTPALAMNADGFVAVWESLGQDGDGGGIFVRRYDAAGIARSAEYQVNTTTAKDQTLPAVAMNSDSAAVVSWQSYAQDKSRNGIYAQRYLGKSVASSSATANVSSGGGGGGGAVIYGIMLLFTVLWRLGRVRETRIPI